MRQAFTWTPLADRTLRRMLHENYAMDSIARAVGCDVEHVRIRAGEQLRQARAAMPETTSVPRPVAVRKAGLIDLSKAPSGMESRFWRKPS